MTVRPSFTSNAQRGDPRLHQRVPPGIGADLGVRVTGMDELVRYDAREPIVAGARESRAVEGQSPVGALRLREAAQLSSVKTKRAVRRRPPEKAGRLLGHVAESAEHELALLLTPREQFVLGLGGFLRVRSEGVTKLEKAGRAAGSERPSSRAAVRHDDRSPAAIKKWENTTNRRQRTIRIRGLRSGHSVYSTSTTQDALTIQDSTGVSRQRYDTRRWHLNTSR